MAKKATARILSVMLVAIIAVSTFAITAFAAGPETWSSAWKEEPKITVTNNNTTPVKTMGASGTLHVCCYFNARPDREPAGCPPIKVTMQIRDLSGNVLRTVTDTSATSFEDTMDLELPVTAGQQYQIFFNVSSVSYNPNGNYRVADIYYAHEITTD